MILGTTAIYRNLPLTIQTCDCRLVVIIDLQTAVSSRQFCQWCCRPLENSSSESSTYEAIVHRWWEETVISWYSTTVQCSILTSGIKPQRTGRWYNLQLGSFPAQMWRFAQMFITRPNATISVWHISIIVVDYVDKHLVWNYSFTSRHSRLRSVSSVCLGLQWDGCIDLYSASETHLCWLNQFGQFLWNCWASYSLLPEVVSFFGYHIIVDEVERKVLECQFFALLARGAKTT